MANDPILDKYKRIIEELTVDKDKKVKVGIIGTGWIAEAHVETYKFMEDVEIVALADLIPGKAAAFAKTYGLDTMMAGGMLEMIRINGGIDYIISRLTRRVRSRRRAESAIASLVIFADICTANNTVAIISVGGIARQIAQKFGISARRTASLLDTFSCMIQGIIPYGAQLLMAAGLATISPVEIIPHLYYPFIMGGFAILAIIIQRPKYN